MKILQVTSTFYPVIGGQEKVVEDNALMLLKHGHKVDILTTDMLYKKDVKKNEIYKNLKIIRKKNKYFFGGYGYSPEGLDWLVKNYRAYDLIHFHGFNRYISEVPIYFLKDKVPMIFTPHGFMHTKKNYLIKILHNLFVKTLIGSADYFTGSTRLDTHYFNKLGLVKNVVEIPNAVSEKFFQKQSEKKIAEFKKKYTLGDKKILLYVGRVHKSKGLQYVIKSIKSCNCVLLIAGPDAGYKQELDKIIKKQGVEEKVIFLGKVSEEDLLLSYNSCDIFVLFSQWEGFGISAIEAMAAGKPCIVSDRGSLPFVVGDNKEGFVVSFKDVNALSEKINFLLNNPNIAKQMSKNSKIKAHKYELDKITKDYEKIYRKAILAHNLNKVNKKQNG